MMMLTLLMTTTMESSIENTYSVSIDITPMGAVRSQGASSLKNPKKRKTVKRYIEYKKNLKCLLLAEGIRELPDEIEAITFLMPIPDPAIGSKKIREEKLSRIGKPHQQKPDWDNLIKPIFDAGGTDDSHVWRCGEVKKLWTEFGKGKIIIILKEKYVLSSPR